MEQGAWSMVKFADVLICWCADDFWIKGSCFDPRTRNLGLQLSNQEQGGNGKMC